MEKCIHLFSTQEEFEAAYNGSEYKEPWLSYVEENNTPAYNKPIQIPLRDYELFK